MKKEKIKNIVAKFARQFNKSNIEPDKKNEYKRNEKHRHQDRS
jgi:hypothetical protein